MPRFLLEHAHSAPECGAVFAAFKAFDSPLRHGPTLRACDFGTHRIWWNVEAASAADALALLPPYVAARTAAVRVHAVRTP